MYTIRISFFDGEMKSENWVVKSMDEAAQLLLRKEYVVMEAHIQAQVDKVKLQEVLDGKEA